MKRLATLLLIMIVLMLVVIPAAYAQTPQEPIGACPTGFKLHEYSEHNNHEKHHIGIARDINEDGFVCVKHLGNGLHVHVDNVLPLD